MSNTNAPTSTIADSFINPYRGIEKRDPQNWLRVSVDVAKSDVFRIRSVTMDWGTMQVALALFVKHLYDYVESRNLTLSDADKLREHVVNVCSIHTIDCVVPTDYASVGTITGRTESIPNGPGPNSNVGPGADTMGSANPTPPNKPTARKRKQTEKTAE